VRITCERLSTLIRATAGRALCRTVRVRIAPLARKFEQIGADGGAGTDRIRHEQAQDGRAPGIRETDSRPGEINRRSPATSVTCKKSQKNIVRLERSRRRFRPACCAPLKSIQKDGRGLLARWRNDEGSRYFDQTASGQRVERRTWDIEFLYVSDSGRVLPIARQCIEKYYWIR